MLISTCVTVRLNLLEAVSNFSANSLEELLTNNNGYDEFIEKTIDIRTPIANGIYQTVVTFD